MLRKIVVFRPASVLLLVLFSTLQSFAQAQLPIRLMELNCENLFDCRHDSLKNDYEYLPEGNRHWTFGKYYRKLNNIAKEIVACTDTTTMRPPDIVALCEVENDTVMIGLTRMSVLRYYGYKYIMTDSPDPRGIDVAILYNPQIVELLNNNSLRINPPHGFHATRDILYARCAIGIDTLHIFVLHAPSRLGGVRQSQPYRSMIAERICSAIDSIRMESPLAKIVALGDFNDYTGGKTMEIFSKKGLTDVSSKAEGSNGSKGTYKFRGKWESLDHVLMSNELSKSLKDCHIADLPFLLEDDKTYGGKKPLRTGYRNSNGFSDHLPIITDIFINVD